MQDRVALFIDGAYLEVVANSEFSRASIALEKLSEKLSAGSDLLRTYYYHCAPYQSDPPTETERARYADWLRYYHRVSTLPRVSFRLGRLEIRGAHSDGSPRFQQKRVDILLTVDLVQHSTKGHISKAVIIAGDSDFVPAIAVAKNEGVTEARYGRNPRRRRHPFPLPHHPRQLKNYSLGPGKARKPAASRPKPRLTAIARSCYP